MELSSCAEELAQVEEQLVLGAASRGLGIPTSPQRPYHLSRRLRRSGGSPAEFPRPIWATNPTAGPASGAISNTNQNPSISHVDAGGEALSEAQPGDASTSFNPSNLGA
jgi:hypothetical protein